MRNDTVVSQIERVAVLREAADAVAKYTGNDIDANANMLRRMADEANLNIGSAVGDVATTSVAYEVRTDVTVGSETFPHVVAKGDRESRAIAIADRETRLHGRSYYVVRVTETKVYTTELAQ